VRSNGAPWIEPEAALLVAEDLNASKLKYTTSVIGFINKCIDDVVPTVTVHTYPKQKPWITGNIRIELKAGAAAFKEW
jgi:hypothetical protein